MHTVKEKLRYGRDMAKEIDELRQAKSNALLMACHIGSGYNADKVQTTPENNSEKQNIKFSDYSIALDNKLNALNDYRKKMIDAINTVDESILRTILIAYYINCKSWTEVAKDVHYDVRHTLRLHGIALKKVIWI